MKQSRDSTDRVTLTLNEYELHNFVCSIRQVIAREFGIDDEHYLERIVLEPTETGDGYCTHDLKNEWESRINNFINKASDMDCELHDDMEYTCG